MIKNLMAMQIDGYSITEQIYANKRTLVYRGERISDRSPVVLKLMAQEYPSFEQLLQFRNQYTITHNLSIAGIAIPYELRPDRHGYVLVLEDGGISLQRWMLQEFLSITDILAIALQISQTLGELHAHRIIHKDIKPSNILIHPTTKQIKLTDFSSASLLPKETQEIFNPNVLEGTLAYISPEQTGRMNRGIDYRTDFYSLGITLFEMLTGQLPFQNTDPMELIHSHIAKQPPQLQDLNPEIPPPLSAIVNKLMAKNAENRYQSALGLSHDLEICLHQWTQTGTIAPFPLGKYDLSDRFNIPEKLYGRETEVEALLNAFERVAQSSAELILVAGFSGIGKTSVVHEVHKPIVRQRGYFIQGKFDQFQRNIPFAAFVKAFRDLMEQLLSETDAQLAQWKSKILAALGDNGQAIVEVIPELERIIGSQPPLLELTGTAAQSRFNLLFPKFIQVFTTADHPLVIFLDDLQWADAASLNLMKLLMGDAQMGHLLLIGAYRDNEVSSIHPLMLTLQDIRESQPCIQTITLEPLQQTDLNQLIADTFQCTTTQSQPFTNLVYEKTQGNPFFVNQFLKALHEDGWIQFNTQECYWQVDISQVRTLSLPEDVAAFMAQRLQKLSDATQTVLKFAACIGNQFDLATLAIVHDQSPTATSGALWEALQEGLILPLNEIYKFYQTSNATEAMSIGATSTLPDTCGYKFLHDRVQQAAYSLIPRQEKQATHWHIGQRLLQQTSDPQADERLFAIVNQLNAGIALATTPEERDRLARLNWMAGRKAKTATAYSAALEYLHLGRKLLPEQPWQTDYAFTLELYTETVETAYLNTEFHLVSELAEEILQSATTLLDRIKIYEIQIQYNIGNNQLLKALEDGLQVLSLLGVSLVDPDTTTINLPSLQQLEHYPQMRDRHQLAALRILMGMYSAAYNAKPELLKPMIWTMVYLCTTYGHSAIAPFAYGTYGVALCGAGELAMGYQSGCIALKLFDLFDAKEVRCKVSELLGGFISHWQEHAQTSIIQFNDGIRSGLETGDLEYVCHCAKNACAHLILLGEPLDVVEQKQSQYIELGAKLKQQHILYYATIWRQLTLNLQGLAKNPEQLVGDSFDELAMLPKLQAANNYFSLYVVYLSKLMLCYLLGDIEQAVAHANLTADYSQKAGLGSMMNVTQNFLISLVLLSKCALVPATEQSQLLEQVAINQRQMQFWAENAPMNNLHKFQLVEAEKHRVLGNNYQAGDLYDRAIAGAKENGYLQEEALANELAAKFYLQWEKEIIATGYMQTAFYCYAHWGAKAKTDDLEKRYPQLLKPILEEQRIYFNPWETISTITFAHTSASAHKSTVSSNGISQTLDFNSILKAAQAISSNIELDELITNLTKIILENSGAKKSVLILPQDDTWQVRAITWMNDQDNSLESIKTILESQSLDTCQDIPRKIINYVKHTRNCIVIDNCQTDVSGLIGEYMMEHQPQSILCTPIINQGYLVGILYLENQVTGGVFTQERLQVINLLSSQAAISLENARLYQKAQQTLQDLQQAQLRIVQSEKMSALGNLVAGVAHEMNNPLGFIFASLNQAKPTIFDITEHLKLYQEVLPNPGKKIIEHAAEIDLDYSLEDLPKMMDSMVIACDRLKNISTSLRTFSRADKDYKVPFNIHEGIDSTILILKHRLKANEKRPAIAVVTEYGNLPKLECFPGQLNQVFMNILANAIDALDESNIGRSFEEITTNPNTITIKTSTDQNQVTISIIDNGKGMSEAVKQKIFDHLFTTKGVGQGTGLGLAIARQIVEDTHGGKLSCHSVLGEGTEFIIEIPL
jgi:predicted ATPase/signal transduction histidine kinase